MGEGRGEGIFEGVVVYASAFSVRKRRTSDQPNFRSLVMRPVLTHSATNMFPSASKQAS